MSRKLKLCRLEIDKKTNKPKITCITIEIPDLPIPVPGKLPGKQTLPPALQSSKAKGLSTDIKKDIHTLARLASEASDIRNPALEKEFAAFAQKAIKHFDLPEGVTLRFEEEETSS